MAYRVDKSLAAKLLEEDFNKYCKLHDFLCAVGDKLGSDELYTNEIMTPFQEAEYTIIKSMMKWISLTGVSVAEKRLSKLGNVQHSSHIFHVYNEWINDFSEKEVRDGFEEWKA